MQRLIGHQASLCVGTQSGFDFICGNQPSICYNIPFIFPLICRNRPSILKRSHIGFTLIELIITVAVASILITIAAPSMMHMVKDNRLSTAINDFIADTMLARSAAIKRNLPVVICKSNNPLNANPTCNTTAANPWSNGWIVFVDDDLDGTPGESTDNNGQRDSSEPVLRQHGPAGTDISLTPSTNLELGLSYRPSGRPQYRNSGTLVAYNGGEIIFCDNRGSSRARAAVVNTTGRPFASREKKYDGTAFTCP